MSIGHWRHSLRRRLVPLAVVLTLLTGAVQTFTATPASAVGNYDNTLIADKALTYVGQHGGQCRAFVNAIVNNVSGGQQRLYTGNGSDYFSQFEAAGGTRLHDYTQLKKGDIVQKYVNSDDLHTWIIVSRDADGYYWVVDSNSQPLTYPETVRHYKRTSFTSLSDSVRAYRMGQVSGSSGSNPPSPPIPWGFETLEGDPGAVSPHNSDVGAQPSAIVFNGQAYVFHYDVAYGNLRYARHTSSGWVFDILDGAGGPSGRYDANVGNTPTAVVYQNQLHAFYFDADNGNLRHAWSSDGVNWSFDNVDGDPGSWGQLNANLGQTPTAIVFNNLLYVFYKDGQNGNLRQAILNGTNWSSFLNIDGDYGSLGGYNGDIGDNPSVVIYGAALHLFYRDNTHTNLRHAWSGNGANWSFENLDGDVGSIAGYNGDVGAHPIALMYGNSLHLFYRNETTQSLRHSWHDSGGWHFEAVTGPGSVTGYQGNIGLMTSGVNFGSLQLFSYDVAHGDLAHIFHNSSGWHAEALDGNAGQPGRVTQNVGTDSTTIIYGGSVHVFYYQAEGGNLRHSWSQ